jgi:hypothetical protein
VRVHCPFFDTGTARSSGRHAHPWLFGKQSPKGHSAYALGPNDPTPGWDFGEVAEPT